MESLERQQSQYKDDERKVRTEISQLKKKREILEKTYNRLKDEKARFKQLRTSVSDAYNRVTYWRGNNFSKFTDSYNGMSGAYDDLYRQIDRILDDMNLEKNELNKQIVTKESKLGWILSILRTIETKLQNMGN